MSPSLLLLSVVSAGGAATATAQEAIPPAIAAAVVLIICSATFSGSETALFSLQPLDRQAMGGDPNSPVEKLLAQPRRTLATLLIGNELTNVTLSTVTAGVALALAPDKPWLNILLLTPLLLVMGEVLPKVLALRMNRRVAPRVAPFLVAFSRVVSPMRFILTRVADAFLVMTGGSTAPHKAELREAQLRVLIDRSGRDGSLHPMEQQMLHRVFDFGDLTVARLMTPRPDIFSLPLTTSWDQLVQSARLEAYSRIPIWQGSTDNMVGVLLSKKLLPLVYAEDSQRNGRRINPRELQRLLLPPRFVPTTKSAAEMLQEFRREHFHMALVVDEHGSLVGVVTLDDLLSELVGELLDEDDVESPEVTEVGAGVFTVRGSMDVDDFQRRFDVSLPDGDYTTLSGFMLDQCGHVPEKGQELSWGGLRFAVSALEGQRVTEINVRPAPLVEP